MTAVFLLVLFFDSTTIVNGFHFLGGTITWHPLNASATGTPVDIVITQTYSWTYSRIPCTSADVATSQLIPVGTYTYLTTQTLDCISNCSTGSTGYVAPSVRPYCTDISAPIGTTVGQRSDTVTLQLGDDFSVAFQQSAWRSLATSASAAWSISTRIVVTPRSDNGLYNNAPVATMMSPIYIPVNQTITITVPVADADGDPTRCRWSTASNGVDECGGVCPPGSLPPNTVINPNCTIEITGQNIGDWFAVTLMVEDFINSSSTTPLSSVPVQFLVQVVEASSCIIPPEIVGIPVEQSCTSVIVGQTFTSELIAINNCGPNVTIVDIATLSLPGLILSNITELNTTTYYKNLSWTPTSAQLGYQVVCAMAFDSDSSQSVQYCFTFYVSANGVYACPGQVGIAISTTTTTITTIITPQKSDSINWPLIGSIASVLLLAALILFCCLCCHSCCTPAGRGCVYERNGTFEFYYIERCTDPDCPWSDMPSSRGVFSTPHKNYIVYNTQDGSTISSDTTQTFLSNALTRTPSYTTEADSDLSTAGLRSGNFISMANGHVRRKSTAGVSISKVKISDGAHTKANPSIKSPNFRLDEEIKDLPLVKWGSDDNVKVFRIKSTANPRTHSFNDELPERHVQELVGNTRARRKSIAAVSILRVTHVLSQPTTVTDQSSTHHPRQWIAENTIRLATIDETREPSGASTKLDKDKVRVNHVESPHRQMRTSKCRPSLIETIELLTINSSSRSLAIAAAAAENCKASSSAVRVERIQTGKKKVKSESAATPPLEPIVDEVQRKKKYNKYNETRVERVPRENTATAVVDV